MPTQPIIQVLDRDRAIRENQTIINDITPLLIEAVNYSTVIFDDVIRYIKVIDLRDFPYLVIFLHNVEMADGVVDLIKFAHPNTITPIVRSMFEGLLSLEYLANGDGDRPLYWMYYYFRKMKESNQQFLPSTTIGKAFIQVSETDALAGSIDLHKYSSSAKRNVDELNEKLDNPIFSTISKAFPDGSLKKDWYSYNGGPGNIRLLAKELGKESFYSLFYYPWSEVSHARDGFRFLSGFRNTRGGKSVLPNCAEFPTLTNMTMSFLILCLQIFGKKYGKEKDVASWYKLEVSDRYMKFIKQHVALKKGDEK